MHTLSSRRGHGSGKALGWLRLTQKGTSHSSGQLHACKLVLLATINPMPKGRTETVDEAIDGCDRHAC